MRARAQRAALDLSVSDNGNGNASESLRERRKPQVGVTSPTCFSHCPPRSHGMATASSNAQSLQLPPCPAMRSKSRPSDRKSVREGKRVSVREELVGRLIRKKKKKKK